MQAGRSAVSSDEFPVYSEIARMLNLSLEQQQRGLLLWNQVRAQMQM